MKLEYFLLPGKAHEISAHNQEALALHDSAFRFWKTHWDHVFHELDGSQTTANDFSRHDYVVGLKADKQILALHLYSVFRLDALADRSHSYFESSFESEFLNDLHRNGFRKVMSMEYLTVAPEVRMSAASGEQLSFAHLIMGLGTQMQQFLQADAAIGPCRCDVKVDRLAKEFGAFTGSQRLMHNVPVVSAAIPTSGIQECRREKERLEIHRLWSKRINYKVRINSDLDSDNAILEAA